MLVRSRRLARVAAPLMALLLAFAWTLPVAAQEEEPGLSSLRIPAGTATPTVDPRLRAATGEIQVVVQLTDAPLAEINAGSTEQTGAALASAQQRSYVDQLDQTQDTLSAQISGLGGSEIARVSKALNAVVVRIDAARINDLAALPGVRSVRPVINYERHLEEVVPYVGAAAVQAAGVDGTGVTVAVLDSGIDYTHRNLGGAGTAEAYAAAYGTATTDPLNTTLDGLFPTEKVVGGYDFVGEAWTNGAAGTPALAPDPDPIDFEGHGTHVADIIGGQSADGTHKGVAPGVKLHAVKVCSAVSSACSGVALLQGVEYILDPNGDGDTSDKVDVANLSLGSDYGQGEDDLSFALQNAIRQGIVVVASAGNGSDRPYILGSPSSASEVISVAQTQVPSAAAFALLINAPASIAGQYNNTATVDWAPIDQTVTGEVAFVGRGCPADSISAGSPEDPYLDNPAGKIALINRGACAISTKVDRAAKAGAIGVLIGLVAPGDASSFSFGGGDTFVPTLVITLADANRIRENIAAPVNVTLSPDVTTPLVGGVVGSSSRGPSYANVIKPDIAAPGASLSAIAGSGDGEEAFGGTSGAAPVVAGAAALLLQAEPNLKPAEVQARLMNTAETNIQTNPATTPGVLAPISRIGGGEVRVDRAINSRTAAWDNEARTGSLSFGYRPLTTERTYTKQIRIRNYTNTARTYTIAANFRYADDAASGAVTVRVPESVEVGANSSRVFNVRLTVDPTKLPDWTLNGGPQGGNGSLLQSVEFDGYIDITDGTDNVHVAWHILPRKVAAVEADTRNLRLGNDGTAELDLSNERGVIDGRVDVFALTGTSPAIRDSELPDPGDNFAIVDLRAVGVRVVADPEGDVIQFAVTTSSPQVTPNYPAGFDIYIDANRDGNPDYIVFNSELNGFGLTGQNVVNVFNVATGEVSAFFFTDAGLNSAIAILTAPLEAVGLTAGSQFDFSVLAYDNYFTGLYTDAIEGMTFTGNAPRYTVDNITPTAPAGGGTTLTVTAPVGGETASPSQSGLLLLYRDAKAGEESEAVRVRP